MGVILQTGHKGALRYFANCNGTAVGVHFVPHLILQLQGPVLVFFLVIFVLPILMKNQLLGPAVLLSKTHRSAEQPLPEEH